MPRRQERASPVTFGERMKTILTAIIFAMCASAVLSEEPPQPSDPYAKALGHSDFVFVCSVIEESPNAHGPKAVFKSYRVTYPESLYFGLVGLDLPGEIWIHFDSSEYPDVPKSGFETTFHKGDTFIAFLDYTDDDSSAFRIVRLDKLDEKEAIKKTIIDHRTSGSRLSETRGGFPQPQP